MRLDSPGSIGTVHAVIIKPISMRLVAYGQKANIAAIRRRAADLLKEEHGSADPAAMQDTAARQVHAEIVATTLAGEVALKAPTPSQAGLTVLLKDINGRMGVEWLDELPVAKTCVVYATWTDFRAGMDWQVLIHEGGRTSDSRPAPA